MAFPKHSILQALSVLLLAWVLVRCQALVKPEEEEEEEPTKEVDVAIAVTKSEPIKCPPDCSCTAEGVIDCAGVDLTEFPADLSDKTRQLSLQNNKIEEITVEHISHLHQLETFNLQNNWLTTDGLEDEGFEMLEHLAYLYLANNKLTYAPKVLPPSLVSADFAANQLTRIYPYTFGHKPKLRSVYLHNNKLTDAGLPDNMFNASDNLEILTMSSNFLRVVPKNLPSTLYRLHLKNNKLEKIPAGAFDNLSNLRELYLQNNLLSNEGMNNETFSHLSSLECLDLSNNNLSVVPKGLPRNLVLLHMEKNSIQSIPGDALTSVRNLEYLLLHNNKLRSRSIHPAAFQGLKKLHTLHMYNNLLERVPRGLPRRAKTLMLLHNSISEIGRNDLALLYTLTELNLSYNKLTSSKMHREAFRKLRVLKTLDLSGNGLYTLPLGLPRSLQVLEVKNNQLNSIPDGALTGMEKLQKLILSDNQLKLNSIYQGAWMELSALTTLDLSGNQLSHIPSDLPESLEYLYLQSNRISSVPASAFEGTPNIKGIFLRFNRLSVDSVDESSFAHLSNLQVLDIGTGNTDLPFKREVTDGDEMMEEEEET
ncbi:podocan [Amphiprion ocellaris]|uniref:podocan n=1 Tax=Amphiprion ocellaris TaxID=80972 RepID=UPI002411033E|nr:podocan [Amphiprion ocellaris]XP_023137447.2 podocan [Amphiprion ocellaris]XP_023137448.2 podocan [Amphiprion ocellaris]XP_023137449.2 podocan [Amphiprion ocellaris]XP_035809425.2 podocan [Amphiprion ocellaris]XP_054872217.1 podocan [Amphiprion ocellaris]